MSAWPSTNHMKRCLRHLSYPDIVWPIDLDLWPITRHGSEGLTQHKQHETLSKPVDLFSRHLRRLTYFYIIGPSDLDLWPSFCTSAMSIMGYMFCISLVKESNRRIRIPPPRKSVFLTFDLDLVTLTLMSSADEQVVVLYTHTEMAIAEYGNECLTKHKPHKTPPKRLDLFLHNMT